MTTSDPGKTQVARTMTDAVRELSLLRIAAQGLAGSKASTPQAAVARIGCLQAQQLPGALISVALRTADGDLEKVGAALDAGNVVRSWPLRATLHLVPAADLGWILSLTRERMQSQTRSRHKQLGIDEAMINRASRLTRSALLQRQALSRDDLLALWEPDGFTAVPQRGYHLLFLLSIRGVIVQGPRHPTRSAEQLFVLADRWITDPVHLDREEALSRLVGTYFRGHGPATLADVTRWTGLRTADARHGLAVQEDQLSRIVIDGIYYWMDPRTPQILEQHRAEAEAIHLLPAFDELLLGYADRSATLPDEHAARVTGGNGMFRPTVIDHGLVCGTWALTGRGRERVTATPFTGFSAEQQVQIDGRASVIHTR